MYTGSHRAVHTACATIPRSCGRGLLLHPRQALVQRHCNAGTIAVMRTDAMLVGFKRTDRHTVSQSARRNATSLYTSTMLTDIFPPSDSRLSSSQSTPVYNPPPPPTRPLAVQPHQTDHVNNTFSCAVFVTKLIASVIQLDSWAQTYVTLVTPLVKVGGAI